MKKLLTLLLLMQVLVFQTWAVPSLELGNQNQETEQITVNSAALDTVLDQRTQYFPKVEEKVLVPPSKDKVWVFILAGQSNMAGRGQVSPQDTLSNPRIFALNKQGELIQAKEPLHFYDGPLTGLDCGLSFGEALLRKVPKDVSIILVPTAVGGSAITQWLEDLPHKEVHLLSNFTEKVAIAQRYGQLKGILWHQGESDATEALVSGHLDRMHQLFAKFRTITGAPELPIVLGELGSFSTNVLWSDINRELYVYTTEDPHAAIIKTKDLKHKGDQVHFDADGQRKMGQRYAKKMWKMLK